MGRGYLLRKYAAQVPELAYACGIRLVFWGRVPDVPQARMGMCCKCVCDLWRIEKEGARVLASANSAPDARRIACDSRAEKSGQMARMMLLIPGVIDSSRENAHHF